jgi:CheY-like chemotaxis protein
MPAHRPAISCFAPGHNLPRILIAEDDALLRRFLIQGLSAAGFAVVAAADGDEALRRFDAEGPFDALLLDEEMPLVTGRDVLRRLRSQGEGLPALMFSGNLTMSQKEQAALGVEAVVRKPCGLASLVETLCHALAGAADRTHPGACAWPIPERERGHSV